MDRNWDSHIIQHTISDILTHCTPQKIFLYAEKRTMSTNELKSFSLCLVVPNGTDCRALRSDLYLALSAEIPVTLNLYTVEEWDELLLIQSSYAAWIARKGQIVYGQTA